VAQSGYFQVQPRIVDLLGRSFNSSEAALKELVANAWDADATRVDISLPMALEGKPIVVSDNGYGMTSQELQSVYLPIGMDRRSRRGPTTKRGRRVRGRLGIGKFSGFVMATRITVTTVVRGTKSRLTMDKAELEARDAADIDLEQVPLMIETEETTEPSGTTVELSLLRAGLEQPDPKKVRELVLRDFGLPEDFAVYIDGAKLTADDLDGRKVEVQLTLPDGSQPRMTIRLLPSQRALPEPGVVVRVDDRAIGKPVRFGLDEDPELPRSVWRRAYVEVADDGLRDDVTGDSDGIIENSKRLRDLQEAALPAIKEQLLNYLQEEAPETEQQFVERVGKQEQLELLPFTQRERLLQGLRRVFVRLFDENRDRRDIVANLVVDIFRRDSYWLIARRIDELEPTDLAALSDVLSEWGFGNMAELSTRAMARIKFLDQFTRLILNPTTGEFRGVHPVLKSNPWIFGEEYELMVSNRTIDSIVKDFSSKIYAGSKGKDRPDLIMVASKERLLLIELKSPQDELSWDNVAQAKSYRDRLAQYFPGKTITTFVLAGRVVPEMDRDERDSVKLRSYAELAADAEARLSWLIDNLDFSTVQPPPAQPDLGI
jgi:hypothetical protein